MANTYLEQEPYYTSSLWTLHVDGKAYHLGEGPKFVERALCWRYSEFVHAARLEAKRQRKSIDSVWLGRYLLRCIGGRKTLREWDNLEPWELYA